MTKRIPDTNPTKSTCLSNFSAGLQERYRLTKSMTDLTAAIEAIDNALKLAGSNNFARASYLQKRCNAMTLRFETTKSIDSLNVAINTAKAAVELIPYDHPNRAIFLLSLGKLFQQRLETTTSGEDFPAALEVWEEDRSSSPPSSALHAIEDLEAAVNTFKEAAESFASAPGTRIHGAALCAALLSKSNDPDNLKDAQRMFAMAVELLPTVSPRILRINDQGFTLSEFADLASIAATFSIRVDSNVSEAIRLLELGRGVIASMYFENRGDIEQLKSVHPQLAREFRRLREEMDFEGSPLQPLSSQTARRHEASNELDEILCSIRSNEGFQNFLRGPSGEELLRCASIGPIVFLNVSVFGADAFIITHDNIRHLPLSKLTYVDVETKSEAMLETLKNDRLRNRRHTNASMEKILEWLWDVAVEPILDGLGFTEAPQNEDAWPQIWWIPVGRLSLFPIHAAGYHSVNGRTALDRVISSYTPTVRALAHARAQMIQIKRESNLESQIILLTSMPTTPNRGPLKFAAEEIHAIDNFLPHSMKRIILPSPTKSEVLERIEQCSVAHFACHGEVDPDPSKSRILFSDWEIDSFSVADMAQRKLDQAELAYISACHAANNRNLQLLDESIHMAGAFQLAGFPTVIGTLWKIEDEHSAEVAKWVYPQC